MVGHGLDQERGSANQEDRGLGHQDHPEGGNGGSSQRSRDDGCWRPSKTRLDQGRDREVGDQADEKATGQPNLRVAEEIDEEDKLDDR